jgi:hypothetical protein
MPVKIVRGGDWFGRVRRQFLGGCPVPVLVHNRVSSVNRFGFVRRHFFGTKAAEVLECTPTGHTSC